jgi:hypothetical protein
VLAPARGACTVASGTCTSSNSSCDTALMVNASIIDSQCLSSVSVRIMPSIQTPIANANIPAPVIAFRTRYGRRARISAADCL